MAPKKEKAVSREELVSLAKEMNEVMGLDPTIKTGSKISDDDLKASIIENGTGQIYETDFEEDPEDDEKVIFTEEATATLKKLGIAIEVADEEQGEEASDLDDLDRDGLIEYIKENDLEIKVTKKMDEDTIREAIVAAQSESSDEETTDDEPEEVVEEKPAKKGKKEEVKEEKKSSKKEAEKAAKKGKKEEPEEEEEAPVKKSDKGAKKVPEKTEKAKQRDEKNAKMKENLKAKKGDKEKGSSLTMSRYEACAVAFAAAPKNKAVDVKKLYAASDAQYVKCGGKSNERENQLVVDRMIDFLVVLEYAKRKDDSAMFTF